jgi:hypothetical protein
MTRGYLGSWDRYRPLSPQRNVWPPLVNKFPPCKFLPFVKNGFCPCPVFPPLVRIVIWG